MVDSGGLENRYTERYLGFESLTLRHQNSTIYGGFFIVFKHFYQYIVFVFLIFDKKLTEKMSTKNTKCLPKIKQFFAKIQQFFALKMSTKEKRA